MPSLKCAVVLALASVVGLGCGADGYDDQRSEESATASGTLALPLVSTAASGKTYRLTGNFSVSNASTSLEVDGSSTTAQSVSINVPVGAYDVSLLAGWKLYLVQDESVTEVDAVQLASGGTAVITSDQTTRLAFRFRIPSELIEISLGSLEIAVDVDDSPATGLGTCSLDRVACDSDHPCRPAFNGQCVLTGPLGLNFRCLMQPIRAGALATCNGTSYQTCTSNAQCYVGTSCRPVSGCPGSACQFDVESGCGGDAVCVIPGTNSCTP